MKVKYLDDRSNNEGNQKSSRSESATPYAQIVNNCRRS